MLPGVKNTCRRVSVLRSDNLGQMPMPHSLNLLPAIIQEQVAARPEPEPAPAPPSEPKPPIAAPLLQEEADLTWEDKEDKLDAENIQSASTDKKYQYKEGGCDGGVGGYGGCIG